MKSFTTWVSVALALSLTLTLAGCDSSGDTDAGMRRRDGGGGGGGDTDAGGGATTCPGSVTLRFFTDADCTIPVTGPEGDSRTYDLTQTCFSWAGLSSAGDNSATNFQCYRDRVCYSQHPGTLTCDNPMASHKEARTDVCLLGTEAPTGNIYALLTGGSESCPVAPDDFECPTGSAGGAGTAACRTEP